MAAPQQSAPAQKRYRVVFGSVTHSHDEGKGTRRTHQGEVCELDDAEAKRMLALGVVELVK